MGGFRGESIEKNWKFLEMKLESCKSTLTHYHDLMSVYAEMKNCVMDMAQIEVSRGRNSGRGQLGAGFI